jgi:hypothetical protein
MNIRKAFQIFMLLLVAGYLLSLIALPERIIMKIIREKGPIENAQVILYLTGAIIAWVYAKHMIWTDGLSGSFILLLFAMRELDFQKKFTGISITRTKYYFHSDASLSSKIIFGIIICGVILFVLSFLVRNAKPFFRALHAGSAWARSALAGLLSIFLANLVDSAPRLLDTLGVETFQKMSFYKTAVEELCELAIPFFLLNALLLYGQSKCHENTCRNIPPKNV